VAVPKSIKGDRMGATEKIQIINNLHQIIKELTKEWKPRCCDSFVSVELMFKSFDYGDEEWRCAILIGY
jgi:hypothetical protein